MIGCFWTLTPDSWQFWWGAQQQGMLRSRRANAVGDQADASLVGWRERVEESLARCLRDPSPAVRQAAAVALARCSASRGAFPELRAMLDDPVPDVGDAACLALGILQDLRAVPQLMRILIGRAEGRGVGARAPNRRRRVHAALALSLLAQGPIPEWVRHGIARELHRIATSPAQPEALRISCLVGLGAIPVPDASAFVPALLGALALPGEDEAVRALCATAAAKIAVSSGDPSDCQRTIGQILKILDGGEEEDSLRVSALFVLGRLAGPGGPSARAEIADACHRILEQREHDSLAGVALVALGEAVAAAAPEDPVRQQAEEAMARSVARSSSWVRPWAALAMARAAMLRPGEGGGALTVDEVELLLQRLDKESNPEIQSAIALALGMGRAHVAASSIRRELVEKRDPAFRGYGVMSLALLADAGPVEASYRAFRRRLPAHRERFPSSLAWSAFPCPPLVDDLLRDLEQGLYRRDRQHWATAAQALGAQRAPSSLPPLLDLLEAGAGGSDLPRAYAAGALGLILARRGEAWAAPLLDGVNPWALPPDLLDRWRFAGALQRL